MRQLQLVKPGAQSALIGAGGHAVNAIIQEFVLRKFTSHHSKDAH